jgi:hypothetical protein
MRKAVSLFLLLGVAAAADTFAQQPSSAGQQAPKSSMPELQKSDIDMAKLQNALSKKRRELFAAGMGGLSADQQQAFWGAYADYEKERDAVMSSRLNLLKQYTDNFATLSDADIVKMVNESAEIQKQTLDLRMKYFGILSQKIGAKAAGRFVHIDDYLTTLFRLGMLDNMPALSAGK